MTENISAKASFLSEVERYFDYVGNHYDEEPHHPVLALNKCAKEFCQNNKFNEAIHRYRAILHLCRELNDRSGEGVSYIKLGHVYGQQHQRSQEQGWLGREEQIACRSRLEEAIYICEQGVQFFGIQGARQVELAVLLALKGMAYQGLACLEDNEERAQEYSGKAFASYREAQGILNRIEGSEREEPPWQEHISGIMSEAVKEPIAGLKDSPRPSQTFIPLCPEAKYLGQLHWQWEGEKHEHIAAWNLCVGEEEFLPQMLFVERDVSSIIAWRVKADDGITYKLETHPGDILLIEWGRFEKKKKRFFFFIEGIWSQALKFPVVVNKDKVTVFPTLTPADMAAEVVKNSKFVGRVVAILKKRG